MAAEPGPSTKRRSPAPCPICGRPADPVQRPFCSGRCRQVDLGLWLGGAYAIPGEPVAGASPTEEDEGDI